MCLYIPALKCNDIQILIVFLSILFRCTEIRENCVEVVFIEMGTKDDDITKWIFVRIWEDDLTKIRSFLRDMFNINPNNG